MSNKPEDLSFFDPEDEFGPERYERFITEVSVDDNKLIVKDNKGLVEDLGQYKRDSDITVEDIFLNELDQIIQKNSDGTEDIFQIEKENVDVKDVNYNGSGIVTSSSIDNLNFTNIFEENFTLEEVNGSIKIEPIDNAASGDVLSTMRYDNYAMFSRLRSGGNSRESLGATAVIGPTRTIVNNIPNLVYTTSNTSLVTLTPGTYLVKMIGSYYASEGGNLDLAHSSQSPRYSGTSTRPIVGTVISERVVRLTITANAGYGARHTKQRSGTTYLGGGDPAAAYNHTYTFEIWRI